MNNGEFSSLFAVQENAQGVSVRATGEKKRDGRPRFAYSTRRGNDKVTMRPLTDPNEFWWIQFNEETFDELYLENFDFEVPLEFMGCTIKSLILLNCKFDRLVFSNCEIENLEIVNARIVGTVKSNRFFCHNCKIKNFRYSSLATTAFILLQPKIKNSFLIEGNFCDILITGGEFQKGIQINDLFVSNDISFLSSSEKNKSLKDEELFSRFEEDPGTYTLYEGIKCDLLRISAPAFIGGAINFHNLKIQSIEIVNRNHVEFAFFVNELKINRGLSNYKIAGTNGSKVFINSLVFEDLIVNKDVTVNVTDVTLNNLVFNNFDNLGSVTLKSCGLEKFKVWSNDWVTTNIDGKKVETIQDESSPDRYLFDEMKREFLKLTENDKKGQLIVARSDLGKMLLQDFDLSNALISFDSSKINELFLADSKLPTKAKKDVSRSEARSAFVQIKQIYEKMSDNIQALHYHALDMNQHLNIYGNNQKNNGSKFSQSL